MPLALSALFSCSDSRGVCLKCIWSGRARGNANTILSRVFPLCGYRPFAKEIHPRPSGLGYFRYGYEGLDSSVRRVSSPVSPAGSLARASPLFGGRTHPSPSSGSSSFLRIPPSHNPHPPLHMWVCGIASASGYCGFGVRRPSSFSHGRS